MTPAVTGVAVALPGAHDADGLLRPAPPGAGPVDPAAVIGRKGLRFKDRATRLGLHLAHVALTDAGLLDGGRPTVPGDRIAAVVSSNLGNADTVCRVAATIAEESTSALSPMDTPNASSNIIASETAIRFGLRGPNLTVCNGQSSGLDALRWASVLLRAGRADHVLVTGVEPDNEVTRRLVGGPVADGGAAVVLSRTTAARPARALLGPLVRTARPADTAAALTRRRPDGRLWLGPGPLPPGARRIDLGAWGELSGALGVVQCAAATAVFARGGGHRVVHALAGAAGAALLAPEPTR
ncbi:beta-ketoacyl synthase N-terminal-like domain-containing protein [Streptomyces sp. NPDC093260]|uniref:beta-ketoacyl synthase N-terminal-like domain-containing protein n=1 Tax=Streptomyces sp. NPDC093260 TaxID=3155073 RepID=UPI00341E8721